MLNYVGNSTHQNIWPKNSNYLYLSLWVTLKFTISIKLWTKFVQITRERILFQLDCGQNEVNLWVQCEFEILFIVWIVFKVCFEASFTMSFKFFRTLSNTVWCWQKDNIKNQHKFRYMIIVVWICAANEIVIKNVTISKE